jgi:hypothetical protein
MRKIITSLIPEKEHENFSFMNYVRLCDAKILSNFIAIKRKLDFPNGEVY